MAGIAWPEAVYLDANILRALPPDLASPDLVRLRQVCGQFKIGMYVPTVAKREWIFFHVDFARKKYEQMVSAARVIGQFRGGNDLGHENVQPQDLARIVEKMQHDRFEAASFVEIPTPAIDLEALIVWAITKLKPFKEGDKGFRDTLGVASIEAHAAQFAGSSIVVISNDDVFADRDVLRRWEEVGVRPLIAKSFEDAVKVLDDALGKAWRQYLDDEAAQIKAFLVTRQAEIFDHIRGVEVSEAFIRGGLFSAPEYFGSLDRVRATRPLEITRVSRGHVLSPREKEDKRTPVTFYVKVAVDITVQSYALSDVFSTGPKVRIGESAEVSVHQFGTLRLPSPIEQELTVERELAIEAWVTENEAGDYVDLKIEKVNAW